VIEDAYRAARLGVAPDVSLFGKATDRAFRRFVEDMLQLFVRYAGPGLIPSQSLDSADALPRQRLLDVITDLVANAVPNSNFKLRRLRYSRSLKLWTADWRHSYLSAGLPHEEMLPNDKCRHAALYFLRAGPASFLGLISDLASTLKGPAGRTRSVLLQDLTQ
jgi:hypothetical protein